MTRGRGPTPAKAIRAAERRHMLAAGVSGPAEARIDIGRPAGSRGHSWTIARLGDAAVPRRIDNSGRVK